MSKILVTGGAGFIGSHLVDALIARGEQVVVLDNFDPQVHQGKKPAYLNKAAQYIEGDVRDEAMLKKAFQGVDRVFHFAAKVGVGQSMYEIKEYMSVNTQGTAVVWQFIVDNKIALKKFVVASSMSIYGEGAYACPACGDVFPHLREDSALRQRQWEPICPACGTVLEAKPTDEKKPLLSTSVYAISKKDQEELSLTIGGSYKIPTVALRFFNVYGPRQALSNPYTGVCAIFSSRIKNNNPPIIFEDGLQSRDFVNVRDIVGANIAVMKTDRADYKAVNVGTGACVSIRQVANTLIKLYGKHISPRIVEEYRAGDIRHCFADITALKDVGYEPQWNLEDGFKELVAWGETEDAQDKSEQAYKELADRKLTL